MRALRCDKLIYAALEPTLRLYLNEDDLLKENHVLKMLLEPMEDLNRKAKKMSNKLDRIKTSCQFKIEDTKIEIGSGAMPLEEFPSKAISLQIDSISAETLAKKFRCHSPPIIGYIRDNRLFFDLRTIFEDEYAIFLKACQKILTSN